jgi:hypothetical protein
MKWEHRYIFQNFFECVHNVMYGSFSGNICFEGRFISKIMNRASYNDKNI